MYSENKTRCQTIKNQLQNMTQEDKKLLLIDLSARLPYGVKVTNGIHTITLTPCSDTSIIIKNEHILPYLRPMSSMTEDEIKEFYKIENITPKVGYICPSTDWHFTTNGFDWLNKKMFDYRGLTLYISSY